MILILLATGCASGGRLDAEALSQEAKTLGSDAAEGALLARDALSGMTTHTYAREHAVALSEDASQTEETLTAATTDPAIEQDLRQLAALAGQVSVALAGLADASQEQERVLAGELQAAAETSQKIAEGLA